MCYMLKKFNMYPAWSSKQNLNHEKRHSFNDSKRRRIALHCS